MGRDLRNKNFGATRAPLQRVEVEAGKIQIFNGTSCIQTCEDIAQFRQMFRHNKTRIIVLIEAFQPLVAEGLNHDQL